MEHANSLWSRWDFSPGVVIPLAVLAALYAAGLARRGGARFAREAAFPAALLAVFAALCSPLDALSEHLFWVHQVQHLLLAMLMPILVALAAPQAVLIAGLPPFLRHRVLPGLITSAPVRAVFAALAHPAVATGLLTATLTVWQIPPIHDAALQDGTVHDWMHVNLTIAGLFFWWRVLDARPPPVGASWFVRLWMLEIAWMMDSLLGGYLFSKGSVLYGAYDRLGLMLSPLADEAFGGVVIWLGGTIAFVSAGLVVARRGLRQAAAAVAPGRP